MVKGFRIKLIKIKRTSYLNGVDDNLALKVRYVSYNLMSKNLRPVSYFAHEK